MKKNTVIFFYIGLFLSLFQYACQKEIPYVRPSSSTTIDDSHILNETLFECTNYESFKPNTLGEPLLAMHVYQNYYCFQTENTLIIRDNNTPLFEENIHVNKFLNYQTKLILCSDEGILEINQDGQSNRLDTIACIDIEIGLDDELLFITTDTTYNSRQIYQLDSANEVIHYTNSHEAACADIKDFIITDNDMILAKTCDGTVAMFQDGSYVHHFDQQNSLLNQNLNAHKLFMLPYNNDVIFVSKNGSIFYQILKYSAGEWTTIKEIDATASRLGKDLSMESALITDAIILNDYLYITTSGEECKGVHKFDLTQEGELQEQDYNVIEDSSLPSPCIEQIYQDVDGIIYMLNNEGEITIIEC